MDREKLAGMYWASMANYRRLLSRTDWLPEDMAKQKLIDKTPFYNFVDQILALIDGQVEELFKEIEKLLRDAGYYKFEMASQLMLDWQSLKDKYRGGVK